MRKFLSKYLFICAGFLAMTSTVYGMDQQAEESSGERGISPALQRLDQYRFLVNEAHAGWIMAQDIKAFGGYDSNVNTAPNSGPLAKVARTGIYHLDYDMLVFRLLNDTSVNFNLSGYFDGYTKHTKLNYGSIIASGRVAQYVNENFIVGGTLTGLRHWQPKKLNIKLQKQSTSFTHWGVEVSPFISFLPTRTMVLDLSYTFNWEDYAKAKTPGDFPFSAKEQTVSALVEKQAKKWKFGIGGDWKSKNFSKFLAFDVDNFGLGTVNNQGVKMKTRDTEGTVLVGYHFSDDFQPALSYIDGRSKDKYQGFESYDYNGPRLVIGSKGHFFDKDHELAFGGNYEKRKYKKQGSESELVRLGKRTLLKFKTWEAEAEDHWFMNKDWGVFEKVTYERRSTNETASQANRSYTRWVLEVGVTRSF